jgi:signal transduction histidine kinase
MNGVARERERSEPGGDDRTAASLRADLERTDLARHLALFYRTPETQLETVAQYVRYGLETDHRCLYLADDNDPERIETALRAADVDVSARVGAGDLSIRDATEVYLDAGFDPDRMVETLAEACHGSVDAGYDGLWAAGENTWCFNTEVSFDHVLDFEATFDADCPDLPVTALCQYDLTRFGERSTAKALWTHEQVVYRNAVCENPYYVPPGEYREDPERKLNAHLMLEQTYDLAHARREVDRRGQRLAVVNRVLRHNIRNDLNVACGVLEDLRGETRLDDEHRDRIGTALRHAEKVVDMAEKARFAQGTIADATVERTKLAPVVERAVCRVEGTRPNADIAVSGADDPTVLADGNLDTALAEILINAVDHQDRDPPTVSLNVSTPPTGSVRIDVRNPGGRIPESDRRALRRGRETELDHASGLGLWLVKWIVENAHGSLSFPDGDDGEARTRLDLQPARG